MHKYKIHSIILISNEDLEKKKLDSKILHMCIVSNAHEKKKSKRKVLGFARDAEKK